MIDLKGNLDNHIPSLEFSTTVVTTLSSKWPGISLFMGKYVDLL